MTCNLNVLKDLLIDEVMISIYQKNHQSFVKLKENGSDTKLKEVKITGVPQDTILIKLDDCEQPSSIVKSNKGQRKRCDYILITNIANRSMMFFFEIKSYKINKTEIKQQFKGAECIVDYCGAILERFHEKCQFFQPFEKRFVLFYKKSFAKGTLRYERKLTDKHSSPDNFFKYENPKNLSLTRLL